MKFWKFWKPQKLHMTLPDTPKTLYNACKNGWFLVAADSPSQTLYKRNENEGFWMGSTRLAKTLHNPCQNGGFLVTADLPSKILYKRNEKEGFRKGHTKFAKPFIILVKTEGCERLQTGLQKLFINVANILVFESGTPDLHYPVKSLYDSCQNGGCGGL